MDSRYNMVTWSVYQQPNHEEKMSGLYKVPYMMYCPTIRTSQRLSSCLDRKPGCFKCPRCGKGYRWLRNMKNHLRVECGKDPKECCPYCPHRTKYKSSLQKHIQRIHFGKKFTCQSCGRSYVWKKTLSQHQKICGKSPKFFCIVCDFKTRFKENLKRHFYNKHKIREKKEYI
ncbi:longitudinals lacking protein isoform X13 [Vespula maculifrons]|uniref:Longitudinals lacking protein isoform X13 n=1 Tax=Vespula maculifrons TaxID=7453 RepID=A0ABD2C0E3_VESMC